ncbi:hypothetical protein MPTK1_1g15150 [Marchantia polymorpha subsp. ruderalis]|uniref:Ureide permease n=2 Tax=Marchantia polymorpha TaxID=3197 RepID=A0AAF6AQD3_MARPO|nr:hypothetical protein MARPO_0033s0146 [Marchantia polymorpha]BBM98651.1 hypothetical protein Mp_1g15150 [Marchantia polymorpha subsp. ruderalis]PTQ41757.1 hypothetical protein MARPO_0033s0146 [Marchantia polymorpha]PTQ41758.1 hypothetical protein MARPO_0033s0146 [Marchantia polymorpha]BBM98652.1 hypothetical protein Mp_1g15150 [Marchantia polymorpha subsp. ruderalis]|eukprot:PTQ41756.1 hypothetical protein MARPO_0033s0146 [Marchantia polymorpha]
MFVVTDKASAIALMIVSLWCLGSWPAFFNVLERRGRLPQHTYLDYAISTYLIACFFALTLGQAGPSSQSSPNFIDQLGQENLPSVLFAMLGGMALCFGNISMQYSLALVGISLTEVVSASIAVVGGTTVNYFLDEGLNKASILFPGVGCFLVAVIIGSFCHASNDADTKAKFVLPSDAGPAYKALAEDAPENRQSDRSSRRSGEVLLRGKSLLEQWSVGKGDMETGAPQTYEHVSGKAPQLYEHVSDKAPQLHYLDESSSAAGSAAYLEHLEETRAIKVRGHSVMFGLGIAFLTGLCYALFSPLFNLAVNDQFHLLKPGVPHLSVYATFFYFSTAFFIVAVSLNIFFLYNPVMGLPKSSLSAYVVDFKGRHLAVIAGLVCGFGNVCQFMGGQAAGYAAADAVQALPLVGTLWGVLLFGEYHRSSRKTYMLLGAMLFMFMLAVVILIASSTERC